MPSHIISWSLVQIQNLDGDPCRAQENFCQRRQGQLVQLSSGRKYIELGVLLDGLLIQETPIMVFMGQ